MQAFLREPCLQGLALAYSSHFSQGISTLGVLSTFASFALFSQFFLFNQFSDLDNPDLLL